MTSAPIPDSAPAVEADTHQPVPSRVLGLVVLAVLALGVYWPALYGPFFSDDLHYIVFNEYIQNLSGDSVRAILDPWGPPGKMTQNYAPVHLLVHSIEWQTFGTWFPGYHLVNVAFHVLSAFFLLLPLPRASSLPLWRTAQINDRS